MERFLKPLFWLVLTVAIVFTVRLLVQSDFFYDIRHWHGAAPEGVETKGPDVSITWSKSVLKETKKAVPFTIELDVRNVGLATMHNVVVDLPIANTKWVNSLPSDTDPHCKAFGKSAMRCTLEVLPVGTSRALLLTFVAQPPAPCGTPLPFSGQLTGSEPLDENVNNNRTTNLNVSLHCTECSDGKDNDSDGATDFPADLSCTSPEASNEGGSLTQCQDNTDNDNDGAIDLFDPGCQGPQDTDELNGNLRIVEERTTENAQAIPGQKNILLLKASLQAALAPTTLTRVTFTAASGTLRNAEHYTLWIDTDNDGRADRKVATTETTDNRIVFDSIEGGGISAAIEHPVVVELRADISMATHAKQKLRLAFAVSESDYVRATLGTSSGAELVGIATDGACSRETGCQMSVKTGASTLWSFVAGGSLFITQDVARTTPRQLLAGTLETSLLSVNLRADRDDIEVTRLVFTADGPVDDRVDILKLYKNNETSAFGSATASSCGTLRVPQFSFCALLPTKPLVIATGSASTITVRPQMRGEAQGAVAGQTIVLSISTESTDATIVARGATSDAELGTNDGDAKDDGEVFIGTSAPGPNRTIRGAQGTVVLSKIASIVLQNNPAALSSADVHPLATAVFSASANRNATNGLNSTALDGLIFTVLAKNTELAIDGFTLSEKSNAKLKVPCVAKSTDGKTALTALTGNFVVECSNLTSRGISSTIEQSTAKTFVLNGSIVNVQIDPNEPSALSVSLEKVGDPNALVYGITASHISWFDRDTASSTGLKWVDATVTQQ